MVLKFITSNIHKYEEALLIGEKYEINISHENLEYIESQNDSFSEIARFSLDNLKEKIQGDFFIEDAGLVIECLNGFPGPYSSFVYSTIGNQGILELMRNEKNRNAKFISTVALFYKNKEFLFVGECHGNIASEIKGEHGFGYDPIFIPNGKNISFGQLDVDEKSLLSHRSIAINKMINFLKEN